MTGAWRTSRRLAVASTMLCALLLQACAGGGHYVTAAGEPLDPQALETADADCTDHSSYFIVPLVGAAGGGLLGVGMATRTKDADAGAALGAIVGALIGLAVAPFDSDQKYQRCMAAKGYFRA